MLRLTLIFLLLTTQAIAQPADVLLTNATIYDGISTSPTTGDVAIRTNTIVAVGKMLPHAATLKIDCSGKVICPGFIDLHNHSDRQIVVEATRANVNYLLQGCTTVVTGNCGSGPVNVAKYYEQINNAGAGTNIAHLLPQGGLRLAVMGSERREPTENELDEMLELAEKAMQDGAWGMSTGLIYVPSSYADTEELVAIAKVVSEHGGIYASHIRGEGSVLLDSVQEAMDIGNQAGLPVHISHFKSSGQNNWGLVRVAIKVIETARQQGQIVTADQYPYRASSTSLSATLIPTWARAGGRQAMLKRLDSEEDGERIRQSIRDGLKRRDGGATIKIARCFKQEWVGQSVAEIANATHLSGLEVVEKIERNGGAAVVSFSMSPEDIRHVMTVPWVATASDGRAYLPGADKPHPRSYGTFPRKIHQFAQTEKVISIGHAIRSSTSLPAKILGMKDRGIIKPGLIADIAVFNPGKLKDKATFDDPHQYCEGIEYVFIGGQLSVYRGKVTGGLHGRALRMK
ncbi:MAG: amidohydrolase family protein [Planctomycetaceae bacterium]|jgi:N-acyl-D-amino-acid deacylase|nr:amidohydrolase family protein [Planctomycetaceae bacterium]